jgi:hypothetical protein
LYRKLLGEGMKQEGVQPYSKLVFSSKKKKPRCFNIFVIYTGLYTW